MTEDEIQLFEAELKRLRPVNPPEQLMERLRAVRPTAAPPRAGHLATGSGRPTWLRSLHWWWAPLAATAVLVLAAIMWQQHAPRPAQHAPEPSRLALKPGLQADEVQIDRRLVVAFEAVARLPDGVPVRFRCSEWIDEVIFRDSAQGVVIQQSMPRFEAVPVRFETY
jgi:hypothetical protein